MSLSKHGLWIWAAVLWTSVQLPFVSGPFRIDDPYHLEAAKQIRRAPEDPYGFQINWDGTPKSAFATYASPPLVPAWLALWSCFFPHNELSMHVAMLPFSIVALVTAGMLAKSFEVRPSIAMALLACSPAFFLASQVLMPDMPMLCLFLLAVTGARFYLLNRSGGAVLIACLAGFCCPLAKYNGAVLVPVLISLGLVGGRRLETGVRSKDRSAKQPDSPWISFTPRMLAIISAPIFSLICWGTFTWAKYGAVHFLEMSAFQRGQAHSLSPATLTAGILGAIGLGVVPLGLLGFLLKSRDSSLWLGVLTLCSGVGAAWLAITMRYGLSSALLFVFSVSISIFIVGLVMRLGCQIVRGGDWTLLPVVVWILAGLAFQYGLMFSAVRYVLFLAPPIILLVLRTSSWILRKEGLTVLLGANLLLVLALSFADAQQSSVYPSVVAEEIRPRLKILRGRLFFDGHWGLQYYASRIGGEPVDESRTPVFRAGDLVVVAKQPWPKLKHPLQAPELDIETTNLTIPNSGFLRTVSCDAGANFYASVMSDCERPTLLPFGFSWEPAERFVFYSIRKPGAWKRLSLVESGK